MISKENLLYNKKEEVKVIIDTNSLMLPFQHNIDIETQLLEILGHYKIIILSSIINELEILSKRGNWQAKSALKLANRFDILQVDGKGDLSIISTALEIDAVVLTLDKKLRNELRKYGIKVITLRDNKLWLDGYLL